MNHTDGTNFLKISLLLSVKNMTPLILLMGFLMNVDLNIVCLLQYMILWHVLVLVHEQISFQFPNILSSVHINPLKKNWDQSIKFRDRILILPCPRFDTTTTNPICRWKFSSKKGNSYSAYLTIEVHIDMENKKENSLETQTD